jgi:hypothetical protein
MERSANFQMKRRRASFPPIEFLKVRPVGDLVKSKDWDLSEHLDFINLWASEYMLTHGKVPSVTEADLPDHFWVFVGNSIPPVKWTKADFNREFARVRALPLHSDTLHLPAEPERKPVAARKPRPRPERSSQVSGSRPKKKKGRTRR